MTELEKLMDKWTELKLLSSADNSEDLEYFYDNISQVQIELLFQEIFSLKKQIEGG